MDSQEARLRECAFEREHVGLGKIDLGGCDDLRTEVVEPRGERALERRALVVLRRHGEDGLLAAFVHRVRMVGLDVEYNRRMGHARG